MTTRSPRAKHIGTEDVNTNINGSITSYTVSILGRSLRDYTLCRLFASGSLMSYLSMINTNLKLVGHLSIRGAKMSKSLKNCEQYKIGLSCLQIDTN